MANTGKNGLSILMIAPQPFFRARGTPFSVLHRTRALLELGHSVDLVTYPFGESVPLYGLNIIRSPRPPFIKDVAIGPSFAKLLLDIPLYFTARKCLNRKKYDVIHSHEEAAFFCVGLARRHRIRHVYDMHSSLPKQLGNFEKYDLAPIRMLFERLQYYVLTTCDGVITICSDLGHTVREIGVDVPHSMIENTADNSKVFPLRKIDVVDRLQLHGKKIVLYTGTFEAYQGLDLLLSAFKTVVKRDNDAHLLMVGGRVDQISEMTARSKELGIEDYVSFTGTVPSNEIPSYMDAASIVVSPRSGGTNTPLKIYEYMKSGVPIVATDLLTHTQTLDETMALLVPATSEGIANGILRVLDDPDFASELANAAMRRAEEAYSDRAYIERVAKFYDDVFYHDL